MDLSPFPKSDSAEASLKDTPQESSALLQSVFTRSCWDKTHFEGCATVLLGNGAEKARLNWPEKAFYLKWLQKFMETINWRSTNVQTLFLQRRDP